MAAITSVEHVAASNTSHPGGREKGGVRAAIDFGGAVTHSDLVQEKLRVDPAALADRQRTAVPVRARDPPPQISSRDERFAEDDAAYDARRDLRGQIVDIEV